MAIPLLDFGGDQDKICSLNDKTLNPSTDKSGGHTTIMKGKQWPVWHNDRAFTSDQKNRGFEARPVRVQVML